MKTTKALVLAGITAISLGVGTAMAQTSNDPNVLTWTNRDLLGGSAPAAAQTNAVQAGSSDVGQSTEQHFPAWVGYNMMLAGGAGG